MADEIKFANIFFILRNNTLKSFAIHNITRDTAISEIITIITQRLDIYHFNMFWSSDDKNFYYMEPNKPMGDFLPNWQPRTFIADIDGLFNYISSEYKVHDLSITPGIHNLDMLEQVRAALFANQPEIIYQLVNKNKVSAVKILEEIQDDLEENYDKEKYPTENILMPIIQWLVQHGGKRAVIDALIAAFINAHYPQIAYWLVDNNDDPDNLFPYTATAAASTDNSAIISKLIDNGWDPVHNSRISIDRIIFYAIVRGNRVIIATLLAAFPDMWQSSSNLVADTWKRAIEYGKRSLINVQIMGQMFMDLLLIHIIKKRFVDDVDTVKFLVERGANIYENAIIVAVNKDNVKIVEFLLHYPIPIATLDKALDNITADDSKNSSKIIHLLHNARNNILSSSISQAASSHSGLNTELFLDDSIKLTKQTYNNKIYTEIIILPSDVEFEYTKQVQVAIQYKLDVIVLEMALLNILMKRIAVNMSPTGEFYLYRQNKMISFHHLQHVTPTNNNLIGHEVALLGKPADITNYLHERTADYVLNWEKIDPYMRSAHNIVRAFFALLNRMQT